MLVAHLRADGSAVRAGYLTMETEVSPRPGGVVLARNMTPPRDARNVRVVVGDTATGALGAVTAPRPRARP